MTPEQMRKLSALGLTMEQIAGVMEIMTEDAEARRSKGRERWHKWNDKRQQTLANASKQQQTTANDSREGVTRVEDNLQTKNQDGEESKRKSTARAARLPHDWTLPIDWRDEAVRAGLSPSLADSEARKMHNWSLSDPKGAKLDWRATWRNWYQRTLEALPRARAGPAKPQSIGEMFVNDAIEQGILPHEPPRETDRRVETRNGSGQVSRPGIARQFTVTGSELGKFG